MLQVQRNTGFLYREKAIIILYYKCRGIPGSLYMYEAIIILQVQKNARLPVERCDNYKITGAEEYLLPVQRGGNYTTKGAEEYQAPCTEARKC
jgi:hypothetical protein